MFGYKFRHCERTAFLTMAALSITLLSLISMAMNAWNFPIWYFYSALVIAAGGYIGVFVYKLLEGKRITAKTMILFWDM